FAVRAQAGNIEELWVGSFNNKIIKKTNMGVYAETSGATITCKNKKVAEKVKKLMEAQAKKSDKNYNVFAQDIEQEEEMIYFSADSGRVQNLGWQLGQIWKLIKNIKGVEELSAPFLMEEDGVYFENK
ncbi:MAG: hypothetical protein Q8P97_02565, partial [bacterium]|nr:hypothetical protein [bacterium]